VAELNAAIAEMRPLLLKLAMLQLRNESWAEDVVSETTLAAIESAKRFEGRAQLRTWVVGILKHKIVDQLRRQSREVSIDADNDGSASALESLFDAAGSRVSAPLDWGDPERALTQQQFIDVLQRCLGQLPDAQGRAFMMREWLGCETAEICRTLGVNANHCNVLLFRARMRLRECIESSWTGQRFGDRRAREASTAMAEVQPGVDEVDQRDHHAGPAHRVEQPRLRPRHQRHDQRAGHHAAGDSRQRV
jgi:RNA polymerase sigma-70 factor (ECF subfamily)